jgi:NodT family efflux transporter outer membrane factor (OMF) lipoprotein
MRKVNYAGGLTVCALLAACSLAPRYQPPQMPMPSNYKEASPWSAAQPSDQLPRGEWWKAYGDPQLDELEVQLNQNSPDLAAAVARYQQTRAYSDQLKSGLLPSIVGSASAERQGLSATRPLHAPGQVNNYNVFTLGADFEYELDLWGRVRNAVAAGAAQAEASAADLASARLSLQAQLASNYMMLRGLDRQVQLLQNTVTAYQRALELTQQRHDGGIVSGLDVSRAQTQLRTAKSQVSQSNAQRSVYEHAIAVLVGQPASSFSIAAAMVDLGVPEIPLDVPSSLLERRPDIAGAQRRAAAANSAIGVARAAYFPRVALSGAAGYQSTNTGDFLNSPNSFWSVGPSLALSFFDFGKRKAVVAQTRAAFDEAGAQYRLTVLTAFKEVEDSLALLEDYRLASIDEAAAVVSAQRSVDFAMTRYKQGAVDYLAVVDAQAAALQTQRDALGLQTNRLQTSVQLIRALGGGWSREGV